MERIYIGSLKCACNLDEIRDIYGNRVTTVVSMLQWSEMRVRGAPYDWDDYFAEHGARQYVYPLDDVAPKTPLLKAQQTKVWFAYLVESVLPTLVSTSLQVAAGTFGRAVPLFWGGATAALRLLVPGSS